jgi:glycosyltransferase involved in cell wall biosynthesis
MSAKEGALRGRLTHVMDSVCVSERPARVIVFQPALPKYRLDFFSRLADRLGSGFAVYFSPTDMGVLTDPSGQFRWAKRLLPIRQLFPGAEWQPGVAGFPVGKSDIVVVSGSPRNLSNMFMLAKAKLRGAKTVWWGQYWSSTSRKHTFLIRRLLMKLSDAILLYTDHEVAEYQMAHGSSRKPIVGLNNGIEIDEVARLRKPYIAKERGRRIFFVGRLTEKAELSLLLQAMAEPRLAAVRLAIVGDGPEKDQLLSLARRLRVDDRIEWHGGISDEDKIAAVANQCRLFVYPGAVGLSLLHAMAYGLPVVVHDDRWGHMPEIAAFYSARNGLEFARGDAGALASAISQAMDATEHDASWSDAARHVADTEFNTRVMADRFCQLVERLAKS